MDKSEFNYLKGLCKGLGLYNATKAMSFILCHHDGQMRNDGSPYYVHPVKVASHLVSLNLYENDLTTLDILITGALLHDILEDTNVTADEITKEFTDEICVVVKCLTKTPDLTDEGYYNGIRGNILASLIKISDRCNNVSTMAGVFSKERLEKYIEETNTLVKPLIRYTRDNNPGISNQVVNMSYHIKSVISAIEVMLPLMTE